MAKEYTVEVKETLVRLVTVKASCYKQAEAKVIEMYNKEQLVLDFDDFVDVEYKQN